MSINIRTLVTHLIGQFFTCVTVRALTGKRVCSKPKALKKTCPLRAEGTGLSRGLVIFSAFSLSGKRERLARENSAKGVYALRLFASCYLIPLGTP